MVKKRILIAGIALLCIAAVLAGIFFVVRWQQGPVKVVSVNDIFTTNSDYGSNTTSGTVRADKVQTAYLSAEDKILELPVADGQDVKKGDLLIRLDTSLSQLQIARQKLGLQKQQMELDRLNREYKEICLLKPYTPSAVPASYLSVGNQESFPLAYTPALKSAAEPDTEADTEPDIEPESEPETEPDTEPMPEEDVMGAVSESGEVLHHYIVSGDGSIEDPYLCVIASGSSLSSEMIGLLMGENPELYIIFLETEENLLSGLVTSAVGSYYWQAEDEDPLYFGFTDESDRVGLTLSGEAPDIPDDPSTDEPTTEEPTTEEPATEEPSTEEPATEEPSTEEPDPGPMYTSKEIAEMKAAKKEEIRQAEIQIRLAEVEIQRLEAVKINEGILAEFDGIVSLAENIDDAIEESSPVLKLTGADGAYYVDGVLGEFALDTLSVGQAVTVNSWMTGESYEGTVSEISDKPADTQGWTNGNPNITYYGFSVRLDALAAPVEGDYVDITLPAADVSSSFYLQKPFILRESGKSYVYLERDGRLTRQEIITGQELWSEYLEILGGITLDDYIAFPYGKNIREGIKTEHSTLDALYGY